MAGRAFEARNQIKEALTNYEKCLTLSQFSHTINAEIELRKILLTNKISLHIKHVSQNCLYIRQLAPGIDFFKDEGCIFEPTRRLICRATLNMAQFIYAIGDRNLKKCILINPSWDIEGILQTIRKDGFKVIASVVTTGLFECIGGYPQENSNIFETAKVSLPGLKELQRYNIPIIMHRLDADSTQMMTGIDPEKILFLDERVDFNFEQITSCPKISKQCDTNLKVEKSPIIMRLLHVPGITRGSQSLVVKHLNQTHLFGASFYYEEGISLKSEQIKFNNEIILSSAPLDSIVYPARLIKGSKIQASTLSAVLNKL